MSPSTFGFRRFGPSAVGTMALAFLGYFVLSAIYSALVAPPCDKLPDDLGVNESTSARTAVPSPVCSAIFQCGRLTRFTNDGAVMQTMHAQVGCAKR